MQSGCAHVVLTRFNVRTPGRERRLREQAGWLKERMELFERFCLPTVAAQTNQNFVWLVYFDDETPAEYLERIDGYRRYPFFKPLFVNHERLTQFRSDIAASVPAGTQWVLTTTLDNDDGWHKDFVANLQDSVTLDEPAVLNFENGLVYHNGHLYLRQDPGSPFASFLEPMGGLRTIWGAQHTELHKLGTVRQLQAPPMWLQVVHGNNVSNRIRGVRVLRGRALEGFPIREDAGVQEAEWDVLMDQVVWRRHRAARDKAIGFYKYFRTMVRGSGPI